jgi:hypothetical protein
MAAFAESWTCTARAARGQPGGPLWIRGRVLPEHAKTQRLACISDKSGCGEKLTRQKSYSGLELLRPSRHFEGDSHGGQTNPNARQCRRVSQGGF